MKEKGVIIQIEGFMHKFKFTDSLLWFFVLIIMGGIMAGLEAGRDLVAEARISIKRLLRRSVQGSEQH